jgi:hypothetical protein
MKYHWKKFRRNVQASLIHRLTPRPTTADIRRTLARLTPYRTEHPLIRFGGDSYDGYLLPDDLDGVVASFSPGVGSDIPFDEEVMARGIPTFCADASVDGLPGDYPLARFDKLFVGARTGGNTISLDDWVGRYAPETGDLILQMDVEGAEYITLDAASDALFPRFRLILIELHQLQRIFVPHVHALYDRVFEKLTRDHAVIHMHPNNVAPPVTAAGITLPAAMEVTLLRRDRFEQAEPETRFPHPLDVTTIPSRPDFALPPFWQTP